MTSWPAQSPDVNIFEPVWGIIENKVRSRSSLTATIKDLASVLVEQLNNIDLYLSILQRISAVLCAKGVLETQKE